MRFANKVELEYQPTSTAYYLNTDTETDVILHFVERYMSSWVTIGIATNKLTARVAAAYPIGMDNVTIIQAGEERAFIARHPVSLLPLTKDMIRRLPLLGIHTLGQFAALPRLAAWEQFGKRGKWIHDLANGIDYRSIQAYQPAKRLRARHEFDDPIVDRMIIRSVLQRLAQQLAEQLNDEEAHRLTAMIYLEDGSIIDAHTQPQPPLQTLLYLTRRLDDLFNQQVITAPIIAVQVQLTDIRVPKPRQLSLFPELDESNKLQRMVPEWVEHHRETGFYYSDVMGTSPNALPEDRFIYREASGA